MLTARRIDLGISQSELARRMNTSQSAISELETEPKDIRLYTLAKWAEALDVSLEIELTIPIRHRFPIKLQEKETEDASK